ncbi:hypothetical protein [Sorangium atrum]|uniref:Secreted protein n=1 Tax=Sorangium atrum TaxID=2995308 RepID=A0ABT5C9N5_9BACT|nr:hypothetical protein [Sorangium aterium]MDC0683090.1 hypothetical protein [Sorangium aterium]
MSCTRPRHGLGARHARCAAGSTRGAGRPARAAVAAAMATTVLLCVAAARAAPELRPAAMRLEVVRGPGAQACGDEAFLRAEVARGLGADPFQDDAPRVLTVTIAQAGPELTASMALRGSESAGDTIWAEGFGTRNGCEALLSGAALAIVAQILNMPERAPPPSEASPEPEPSAPPSPPLSRARRAAPEPVRRAEHPKVPTPPEAAPSPPEPLRLEAGLGATLGLGTTPGPATGMTLAFGVRRPAWSIAVEGRGLISLVQEVEGTMVDTTSFTTATVACYHHLLLFGCGLATIGTVRFTPHAPWTMRRRSDAIFGFGARLGAEWPLSRTWSARGYAEATWIVEDAALMRMSYDTATPAPLFWSSSPLGTAVGLGVTATY